MSPFDRGEGRAFLAPWIVKLLATAFLGAAITWATAIQTHDSAQARDIAVTKSELGMLRDSQADIKAQLSRIEAKIDALLIDRATR
jgi:hypothetical protein